MVLWQQVVCLLLILTCEIVAKGNRYARVDRKWKMQKKYCIEKKCGDDIYTNMNCVNMCVSPVCYEQIYGLEPLEDGEVDDHRAFRFTSCLRKEFAKRKVKDEL